MVQNGLWWGDTQEMPPLFSFHVSTEQNGLGYGLYCINALGVFSQLELAFFAPLDSLLVRVFFAYECLWQKFLPKLKILREIGKKKICGKCFWNFFWWAAHSSKWERKLTFITLKSKGFEVQMKMLTTTCSQPNSRLNMVSRN